jgi:hypothetical protein
MSKRRRALHVPPLGTLVEVVWEDAAFDLDDEENADLILLHTVGWIVKTDRKGIAVAGERSSDGSYCRSFTTIPKSLVRWINELYDQPGL